VYESVLSEITLQEISASTEILQQQILRQLETIHLEIVEITEETITLAEKYIEEQIIPLRFRSDALHIAAATLSRCDVLASWNFKHIVKLKTILGVNGINQMLGYSEIKILTPQSLSEENYD